MKAKELKPGQWLEHKNHTRYLCTGKIDDFVIVIDMYQQHGSPCGVEE